MLNLLDCYIGDGIREVKMLHLLVLFFFLWSGPVDRGGGDRCGVCLFGSAQFCNLTEVVIPLELDAIRRRAAVPCLSPVDGDSAPP